MEHFSFGEHPNVFELDLNDGRGTQEFFYTQHDNTVWVEPAVNTEEFNKNHGSLVDGLYPVREDSTGQVAQLIWRLSRPWRDFFNVEGAEVPVSETSNPDNGSQPPLDQSGGPNLENEFAGVDIKGNQQQVSQSQALGHGMHGMGVPSMEMDIDSYAALKYAPLIENQALIIEIYESLLKTNLEPDNAAHDMIEKLKAKSDKLMENYYDEPRPTEPEPESGSE